ncbi:MAG: DEAD/DEAH box helicase, partial [Clostridia bacterium]
EDLDVILKTVNDDRQTMLFSATMSKDIMDITKKYQKPNVVKCIVEHKNITSPQIKQYIVKLQENRKLDAITKILDSEDYKLSVIFCNTKRKVDELEESLSLRGYLIKSLHGDMDQKKRDSVMNKFRNGKLNILVATDVAARGIDVENIECVFNYDIPYDEEYYVHRIGRTGRAGKDGIAISFVTPKEMFKIKDIQKYTKCVLEDYKFIDNNELKEKKYNKLFDKLSKIVLEENLEKEESIIEEYVSNSEYSLLNLCAAFVKDSIADNVKIEDIVIKDINKSRKVDKGNVRLFLTIGKLDEVTRNSLRDYVVETAKVNRSDIHNAEVLDKFSFLTVSESAAKEIIKKLNNTKYNNRRLVIEESTKK